MTSPPISTSLFASYNSNNHAKAEKSGLFSTVLKYIQYK